LNIVIEIFVYYKYGSTFKRPVIFYLLYLNSVIKSIVTSSLTGKEKTHKRSIKVTDMTIQERAALS
jgi:hypothetical protein